MNNIKIVFEMNRNTKKEFVTSLFDPPHKIKKKRIQKKTKENSFGNEKSYNGYKFIKIQKCKAGNKKYDAIFRKVMSGKDKVVSFGKPNQKDFTQLGDRKYRDYYLKMNRLDDSNLMNPKALEKHILWNKPTITESVEKYKRLFKKSMT